MFINSFEVIILLILCYYLVHIIWRFKKNPDNYSIPLLTATGDLLGVSLLFICFHVLYMNGNTSLKYPKLPTLDASNSTISNLSCYTCSDPSMILRKSLSTSNIGILNQIKMFFFFFPTISNFFRERSRTPLSATSLCPPLL